MRTLVVALSVFAGACTATGDSSFDWEPYIPPGADSCEVAQKVFLPYCTACHDGFIQELDLRPSALGGLANMVSPGYNPALLVVPGDRDASLLFRKSGVPGNDDGDPMPPGSELPAGVLEVLGQWIDAGAPACDGGDVPSVVPGGPIVFGGPPSRFAARDSTVCAPQQFWTGGDSESASMHPGLDCIGCHNREGEGPRFSYAGTVHASLTDVDDCRGVPGVKVELLDQAGETFASTTTNQAGNFSFRTGFRDEYRVRLSYEGRTREMQTPQSDGACATCHMADPIDGSPGRIVVP